MRRKLSPRARRNGFLIPMPATVSPTEERTRVAPLARKRNPDALDVTLRWRCGLIVAATFFGNRRCHQTPPLLTLPGYC